ncbi:hypothetical protein DFP81_10996 [Marinomonas pollencensis]|uniref:Uncharacterized protein n=1 Tax=Marinomonas pollencensis TaxID=491954 RepID=A0A3E0DK44_9GAMM|nr:hypothetical protein DFP81_10996 [Marinomonas pollencensis]
MTDYAILIELINEGLKTRLSRYEVVSFRLKAYIPLFIKVCKDALKIALMAVSLLEQ